MAECGSGQSAGRNFHLVAIFAIAEKRPFFELSSSVKAVWQKCAVFAG